MSHLNWYGNKPPVDLYKPATDALESMKEPISDVDQFVLNIYNNEKCKESLCSLYSMSIPDLLTLHSFLQFQDSLTVLQNHHQLEAQHRAQQR